MAFPTFEPTTSGADNTENMKNDDLTEEDDCSSEQSKETVASTQRLQYSLLIIELYSIEEHQLKQQGEITIENTTQNDDLMIKEISDSGEVTFENSTQNDDLMMKKFNASVELTIEDTNDNDDLMMPEADDSEYPGVAASFWRLYVTLTVQLGDVGMVGRNVGYALSSQFNCKKNSCNTQDLLQRLDSWGASNLIIGGDMNTVCDPYMDKSELQRQIVLQRQLERKRLFADLFGKDSVDNYPPSILSRRTLPARRQLGDSNKTLYVPSSYTGWGDPLNPDRKQIINSSKDNYPPLILSRRTLPARRQLGDSNKTLSVPSKDTGWGDPLNPARKQIINSSKGDRNIKDNQGFTDQAEEKSQQTITKRKFTKFSMKSQFKDTNVIINKLKDFFFLMNEITWILCVLIATSQVVVAETALTKTLSVPVSSDIELCGLTCETSGMYTLDREFGVPILDYFCPEKSINFHDWNRERLQVNVSTGCCIIKNALKSDTGNYELMFQGTKKEIWVQTTSCLVIDPVSACIITTEYSDSGETLCLRVSYSGEEATVLWTWNGGDLPERHQLSDSNKTLTVPSTDTGTFTVLVSNPVSHTSTHYNLTLPESHSRMRIGLCAALSIVSGMAIIALKGPARYKFERMKQNNTANKNSATADNLVSQDSFMVSDDVSFKEKAEMCV